MTQTFEEQFPSYTGNLFNNILDNEGHPVICSEWVKINCLDKQKVRDVIINAMNQLRNDTHPNKKVNELLEQRNLGIISFQRLLFEELGL